MIWFHKDQAVGIPLNWTWLTHEPPSKTLLYPLVFILGSTWFISSLKHYDLRYQHPFSTLQGPFSTRFFTSIVFHVMQVYSFWKSVFNMHAQRPLKYDALWEKISIPLRVILINIHRKIYYTTRLWASLQTEPTKLIYHHHH